MLPTTNYQMIHYVIIKNLLISHNHMKKTRMQKKNLKLKQQPQKAEIEEKPKNTIKNITKTNHNELSTIDHSFRHNSEFNPKLGPQQNGSKEAINFWRKMPFRGKFSIFSHLTFRRTSKSRFGCNR